MCAQRSYKQHIYKIYLSNTYLKSSIYRCDEGKKICIKKTNGLAQ